MPSGAREIGAGLVSSARTWPRLDAHWSALVEQRSDAGRRISTREKK